MSDAGFLRLPRFGMKLAPTPEPTPTPREPALEELLLALTAYGRPRVSQMDDGDWYCVMKMHVAAAGTTFEIRSDYTCASPTQAVRQCAERVQATLASMGAK